MDAERIARTLRGGDASPENPYLIRSPFDYNLEIAITNEQRLMGTEEPVYLWRLRKWYYDQERESYRQMKYFTPRELFLVLDMMKDAKERMGSLYRPIFAQQEERTRRGKLKKPYIPLTWDCDTRFVEEEPRFDEPPEQRERVKYPWED